MFHLLLQLAKNGSRTPSQSDSPVPASAPSEVKDHPQRSTLSIRNGVRAENERRIRKDLSIASWEGRD